MPRGKPAKVHARPKPPKLVEPLDVLDWEPPVDWLKPLAQVGERYTVGFAGIPEKASTCKKAWARNAEYQEWKQAAVRAYLEAGVPPMSRVRVDVVFLRKQTGRSDQDNDTGRLKPILDGLVAAGVVPNDTRRYVWIGTVRERLGSEPETHIRLTADHPACLRCEKSDVSVAYLDDFYAFCADCYAALVGSFLRSKRDKLIDYLDNWWLKKRGLGGLPNKAYKLPPIPSGRHIKKVGT